MASTNLASKVSRAVCAYLVSEGVASNGQCHSSRSRRAIDYSNGPIVEVHSMAGEPLTLENGNQSLRVVVTIAGAATQHPEDANDETEAVVFDAFVGAVKDALHKSDSTNDLQSARDAITAAGRLMAVAVDGSDGAVRFAANNADMTEFTLLDWQPAAMSEVQSESAHWVIELTFPAVACESVIT